MRIFSGKLRAVPDHEQDLEAARAILAGDERALAEFIDYYFPRLYRFVLARVNYDHGTAEEIVQDTVTIAARRMETYRGEAAMLTWLTQICRRELVRTATRLQRSREVVVSLEDDPVVRAVVETLESGSDADPLRNCAQEDVARLVQSGLDQLPDHYADVLEWKYVEGHSTREIAERLGIGREAAESLLARARRAFRDDFREILASLADADAVNPI